MFRLFLGAVWLITTASVAHAATEGEKSMKTFWVVPYTHMDLFWLGAPQDTLSRGQRIIERAMAQCEASPEYRFLLEDMIFVADFLEKQPDQRERLKRLVDNGQIELSAKWVGIFQNAQVGEDLVRSTLYAKQWAAKALGADPRVAYFGDHFGYTPQFPQIYAQMGVKAAVFTRDGPDTTPLFHWQAPDGSKIWAFFGGYGTATFTGINYGLDVMEGTEEKTLYWSDMTDLDLHPFTLRNMDIIVPQLKTMPHDYLATWGIDLMMTPENLVQDMKAWNAKHEAQIRLGTLEEYFNAQEQVGVDAPILGGDAVSSIQGMFGGGLAQGDYSHAQVSHLLLMAEKTAALAAAALGTPYPHDALRDAWKGFLTTMDHNSNTVYAEAAARYREHLHNQAVATAEQTLQDALRAFAENVDAPSADCIPLVVFNTNNWSRAEAVEVNPVFYGDFAFDARAWHALRLVDARGNDVPFQIQSTRSTLTREARLKFVAEVPALGYTTYYLLPEGMKDDNPATAESEVVAYQESQASTIENEFYRLEVNAGRDGVSVWDKALERKIADLNVSTFEMVTVSDKKDYFNYTHANKQALKVKSAKRRYDRFEQQLVLALEAGDHNVFYTLTLPNNQKRIDGEVRSEAAGAGNFGLMHRMPMAFAESPDTTYGTPYGFCGMDDVMAGLKPPSEYTDVQQVLWKESRNCDGWVRFADADVAIVMAMETQGFRLTDGVTADIICFNRFWQPEADTRPHVTRFSLRSDAPKQLAASEAARLSAERRAPLQWMARQWGRKDGRLPAHESYWRSTDDNFIVTVLKATDDGAWVLRGFETSGGAGKLRPKFGGGLKDLVIQVANMLEAPGERVVGPIGLKPQEIVTLRLITGS